MNVDDAETILDAAGDTARPGRIEDGVSLLRYWRDGGLELGRDMLVDNSRASRTSTRSARATSSTRSTRTATASCTTCQKDPYELQSQHANPAYDAVKAALATRLHNLVRCCGCELPRAAGGQLLRGETWYVRHGGHCRVGIRTSRPSPSWVNGRQAQRPTAVRRSA